VEWQWHQLDHMQSFAPCSRQITTPVPHNSIFTGRMPFLPPNEQYFLNDSSAHYMPFSATKTHAYKHFTAIIWVNLH